MQKNQTTKWVYLTSAENNSQDISTNLNISSYVTKILLNRNIKTAEEANNFLFPLFDSLPETKIPHVENAAKIVYSAIKENKKFVVYGDYDVDGITGTTLLTDALRNFNVQTEFYIPHRYTEGYGLNCDAVRSFAGQGFDFIITVDCGISNVKEIKLARQLGLDVIVIDHHTPPPELPEASAIVNPKLNPSHLPYYHLSGVGVAYKFIEMLFQTAQIDRSKIPSYYLELVALGTITDIVPLLKENRTLTYYGLSKLNQTQNIGINNLKKIASLKKKVNTYAVGFILGPRLNAAGRLEHASLGVKLLLTKNETEAWQLSNHLHSINETRKSTGKLIKETIIEILTTSYDLVHQKSIVIAREAWHPGIIGVVSSQIASQFCRPTVLIAINEGKGRGSVRSVANIDIFTPLSKCSHLFTAFGGHKEAAGFEILTENIPAFEVQFKQIIDELVSFEDLQPVIKIDLDLKPKDITLKLAKEIMLLEPFGQSNPEPVFCTKDMYPIDFRTVGDGSHLHITFSDGMKLFTAIGFGMSSEIDKLQTGSVDIVYHLKINEWNKNTSVQLQLIDIQKSD
ncbi:MAG: single-stranded-DNA-specific exonuclease RecJ [Candidatus Margulisiibacteriota bacterium]|nr:MAG: single-stranded-DNA-specific exonuclease RecJ [Candidatus Margulisbacteria bacterium GWD2_39_127]OGI01669.1 MAG: single-stranded-DNA-specific exonuclease RecJ [Candidatus Margulisbacteria bacterium GWF2_38_17]OGI05856.1 MAG: single-stranded-DNA-specific exonuclease RecJ [Candidatus Margulisbacteria bacterium GWE2_39_32]PZM81856.1 MAG: single-stranded-DNA-specific exonuclease RecJ [Candidatus Margulisiibacteriota bacterium]HAR63114.1 single-stranded-DNA-specific exonuclease RecJ [Candida